MSASLLYRQLTGEEILRIADAHFAPARLVEATRLTGGMFNTTYRLTLTDGQRVVLRVGPVNRHLLMPFEHGMMAGEAWVYAKCREAGIPVSEVIAVDDSRTLLDRDYMLVRYLHSMPLSEYEAEPDEMARLHRETGRIVRQMHGLRGPSFGRVSRVCRGAGYATWREAVLADVQDWLSCAEPRNLYTPAEFTAIRETYRRYAPLFDEITEPRLVHADLWAGNVLVAPTDAGVEVGAVIDADRAFCGDPEIDFASGWMSTAAFYEGCGKPDPASNAVLRRKLYALLYALIDSYVWQVEYNEPENAASPHATALRLLEELANRP